MICFWLGIRFPGFFQCFLLCFLFPVCFYIFHLAKLLLALDTLIVILVNYLFDVVTFFDNVRIALYFGTFELSMEITLQLYFVFAWHCEVFLLRHNYVIYLFVFVTFFEDVKLRYILVRSNFVLKLRFKMVIF